MANKSASVFARAVNKMFSDKYLLYTNIGLSFAFFGLGDMIEQDLEIIGNGLRSFDKERTKNMAITGIFMGILKHYWYISLDRIFTGNTVDIVAKKIIVDLSIGSPISIATFFIILAILEGSTVKEFLDGVRRTAWKLYIAEWIFWPPLQSFNFYILPTKYRVLFDNAVSLLYDIYYSRVKHYNPATKVKGKW